MKTLVLSLSACLIAVGIALAGNKLSKTYVVNVTTSGVTARAEYFGRKTLLFVNGNNTNTIYISSASINSTNYESVGSIPLAPNYGYYEDNYYVYKSTWYACTSTGTAKLHLLEKE